MRRLLCFLMFVFLLSGCAETVKYICSDGSVVANPSACPLPENPSPQITTPEVTPSDIFVLKKEESIHVFGKKVTLDDVFDDGKTVVDVNGIAREIKSTKYLEIIDGLEVIVQSINFVVTDPDSSSATLKINPLTLNNSEYLFFVDEPQVVYDVEVTLEGVTPSYILVDTDDVLGMKIYPGSSKIISGLNITNVRVFPHGIRAEDYAILRIYRI